MLSAERMAGFIVPPRLLETLRPRLAMLDTALSGTGESAVSARIALFAFAVRVVSAAIAFFSQVLLARWMGSAEYGVFVFVLVASVIVGGLSCLGFQTAVIRFAPEYESRGEVALLRGILFTSRVFALAVSSLFAAFGLLALWMLAGSVPDYYMLPLVLGVFCLPALAISEILDGTARAHDLPRLALLPTYIVRPLLIVGFMALAIRAGGFPADAVTATAGLLAATLATTLGQFVLVALESGRRTGRGPRTVIFASWMTVALPIFLVEGFFTLLTNIDILMVGHFLPPEDVAVYYASVKTLALVHFVYFAVKASAAQRFSQYRHSGQGELYARFVAETVRWTFWPSLAMSALVLLFGPVLLGLFGPDFSRGYPLLLILVVGIMARASVGPAESVLTMSGEQNACAAVYFATIVINIGLTIMLIPLYGLYGAALATALAMVFEAVGLYAMALRRLGLSLFVFTRRTTTHTTPGGDQADRSPS